MNRLARSEIVKEIGISISLYVLIISVLGYFFYRSIVAVFVIGIILGFPYYLYSRRLINRRIKWKQTLEFKEMLRILSSEIQAGNSVENAFYNTNREMKNLSEKSTLAYYCEYITNGIKNNEPVEKLLYEMSDDLQIEEVKDFVEVFAIAKRSGGNLREIIKDATNSIDSKIELKREYKILISSKQFEHRIMCMVPFGIIGYIGLTSKGYFDLFYKDISGRIIMTAIMIVYLGALLWGEKIINVKL